MGAMDHGYNKGDMLIVDVGTFSVVVEYLGYSEIDYDNFIGEGEDGCVSDAWKWNEIKGRRES